MRHHSLAVLAVAATFALAPVVRAATFCPGTANALQTALSTASTNSQNNTIKVQAGTYFSPANGFLYNRTTGAFSLDIEGGWNAGCTVQTPDASLTTLDGQSQNAIMGLADPTASNITVRYLEMTHATAELPTLTVIGGGAVHVDNCRFRLNVVSAPSNSNLVHLEISSGPAYFTNNVVTNNTASAASQIVGFALDSVAAGVNFYANNNTIADNAFANTTQSSGTLFMQPDARGSFSNNILWGNGGNEFSQNIPIHPVLLNNDIDVLNITPDPSSSGNIGANPKFVSVNNHHVQSGTPTYNAGYASPPGGYGVFDLDGNPRVVLGVVDIGAYELQAEPDEIFFDGFDGL